MSFKRWFATGCLIILALSFASSTAVLLVLREREESRRMIAEAALSQTRRSYMELESQVEIHQEKSAQLEREFSALQKTNQFALGRLREVEKKLTRLQRLLTREHLEKLTLAKERNALNNRLNVALGERKSLQTQVNKFLARSPEEVDLGQIVVSAVPPLEGKVLVVNQKFQFVVVDLGSEEELGVGALLNVYRQDQFIGRLQVEQVRESVAACRVLPEWTSQEIQENDAVREL